MVVGDINRIELSLSSFERMITEGNLYVDKTRLIEHFLSGAGAVQLVARQRRLGKSLNMDMLRCFLTDRVDFRHLFKGLYIESHPVWEKANSAPVFYFDFKELTAETYQEQIIDKMVEYVCSFTAPNKLEFSLKRKFDQLVDTPKRAGESLRFLTEMAYNLTGKRAYLLIDEYDKLLMENYDSAKYEEIKTFETTLLSSALKGNHCLEKALLTGVTRVSHESLLSGLNNVVTFDVFNDELYTADYGLTDDEMIELSHLTNIDIDKAREWYNGIRIGGHAIYNIYSVMSHLSRKDKRYSCFWGQSGTMDVIARMLNDNRKTIFAKLLNGEDAEVAMSTRISLKDLSNGASDNTFYSLLVQSGYLALNKMVPGKPSSAIVTIPNAELMMVWREFILDKLYSNAPQIMTLFDNAEDMGLFSRDLEYFLSDRLSYHDLAVYNQENKLQTHERVYHVFLLGILSAYEDARFMYALSNRESGDGRYDILVERATANYIFEVKSCDTGDDLESHAKKALAQIDSKRYGADFDKGKRLVKIGIAICGKRCRVKCDALHSALA